MREPRPPGRGCLHRSERGLQGRLYPHILHRRAERWAKRSSSTQRCLTPQKTRTSCQTGAIRSRGNSNSYTENWELSRLSPNTEILKGTTATAGTVVCAFGATFVDPL